MKFVIIIRVDRSGLTEELSGKFYYEVRELLRKTEGDDASLLERTGPTLARGVGVDFATTRLLAEEAAELLANEQIYVYDTDPAPVA